MLLLITTQPLTVLLLLTATVLLIFLGKEINKPLIPAMALIFFLLLVVWHSVQLCLISYEPYYVSIRYCIAFELIMVLVTFLAYIWIDNITSKLYNKKTIEDKLDWFWKQV